jgi:hypothetical protein
MKYDDGAGGILWLKFKTARSILLEDASTILNVS